MPTRINRTTEIFDANEKLPARDPWIEKLAWLMDSAIPIGPWRIGLDSVVGLVPGFGDLVGALVSMLIVLRAMSAGVPKVAVARMMTNIAIDSLVGAIPIAGDFFDMAYKSNLKNLKIYEESLSRGQSGTSRHWGFFALVLLVAAILVGTPAAVVYLLMR
jgi:hypothetical protein